MGRMSELAAEQGQDEQSRADGMEEIHFEVSRVVELACRALSPADQDLLRWATGVQKTEQSEEQPRDYPLFPEDGSDPF